MASLLTADVALHQAQASSVQISATSSSSINLGYLGYILGVLVLFSLLVLVFGRRKEGLFRKILGVYFFLFLLGMAFVLASIFVAGLSYWVGIGVVVACCAIVAYLYLRKRIEFFNVFGIIIAVTAPLLLGFDLGLWTVVALLIILAVYDFIAVFITKHMQAFARLTMTEGAPLPTMMVFGEMKDMKAGLNKIRCRTCGYFMIDFKCTNCGRQIKMDGKKVIVIKEGNPKAKKAIRKTFMLGLGDLIVPAIFPISILLNFGMLRALFVVVGGTIGVALNLYIVKKKSMMLPALPLIVVCMLIASVI